jgi:geranylgeranyl pyrophosphate synthase
MSELAPLEYPRLFQGIFGRVRGSYEPLLEDARRALQQITVPGELRLYLDYVVQDNPQPSFLLLPLLFLATAESMGGITPAHRRCLPVIMLSMELVAIADDTVDRTLARSGRPTFPARFGEGSATPFAGALMAMVAERARRVDTRVFDHTMRFFVELFANELWERQNLYPPPEVFDRWLEHRYRQSAVGAAFALNTALILSDRASLSEDATEAFGHVFQDVDDLVNLLEPRDAAGENDDVVMGMITMPLLHALRCRPALLTDLEALWETSRALGNVSIAEQPRERARLGARLAEQYRPLREAMLELAVPAMVERVLASCGACVSASPPGLRGIMREMTGTFADRLRRCGVELSVEDPIGPPSSPSAREETPC